jgi:hypothetical protein
MRFYNGWLRDKKKWIVDPLLLVQKLTTAKKVNDSGL